MNVNGVAYLQRITPAIVIVLIALSAGVPSTQLMAASFDCKKAATRIEKHICVVPETSDLDEKLAAAYQHGLNAATDKYAIQRRQREWLTTTRDKCCNNACLNAAYKSRLIELGAYNGNLPSVEDKPCSCANIEAYNYSAADARLDYAGNNLIIRLHANATGMITTSGFNTNDAFRVCGDMFEFTDGSFSTTDLIVARGFDLEGTEANEIIVGTNATDRIKAGRGDDFLNGGAGDDTYFYDKGDGRDCISDPDGNNTVVFGQGISPNRIVVSLQTKGERQIARLRLLAWYGRPRTDAGVDILLDAAGNSPVQVFRFSDGSNYVLADLIARSAKFNQPGHLPDFGNECIFDTKLAQQSGFENQRLKQIPARLPPQPIVGGSGMALQSGSTLSAEASSNEYQYKPLTSMDDGVCKYMLNLFNEDIKKHGHEKFGEHGEFKAFKWRKIKYTYSVQGQPRTSTGQIARFDVNNDGNEEMVFRDFNGRKWGYDNYSYYVLKEEPIDLKKGISSMQFKYALGRLRPVRGSGFSHSSLDSAILWPFRHNETTYLSFHSLQELQAMKWRKHLVIAKIKNDETVSAENVGVLQPVCFLDRLTLADELNRQKEPMSPPMAQMRSAVAQASVDSDGSRNCNIKTAPPEALRQKSTDGVLTTLHYPDPRSVSDDYSGCLNVWFETNGRVIPMIVARFEKGHLVSVTNSDQNVACHYRSGKLIKEISIQAQLCPPAGGGSIMEWKTQ